MKALVLVALLIVAAAAIFALLKWLERATNRPGLASAGSGILLLAGAAIGVAGGERLLPFLFTVQAVASFYNARRLHLARRGSTHVHNSPRK